MRPSPSGPRWSVNLLTVVAELLTSVLVRADAETRLQASEERFRKLADLLPQPIYESDLDGRILYANQTAFTVFHVDPSQLDRGIISYDLLSPEDREAARQNSETLIRQGGTPFQRIHGLTTQRANVFPSWSTKQSHCQRGKTRGVSGHCHGHHPASADRGGAERKRGEVTAIWWKGPNDGVAIVSEDKIRFVNQPICKMLGMSREAILGQSYADFVSEEDRKQMEANVRQRMQGEPLPSIFEIALRNPAGHVIPVEVNIGLIPYQGPPFGLCLHPRHHRTAQGAGGLTYGPTDPPSRLPWAPWRPESPMKSTSPSWP